MCQRQQSSPSSLWKACWSAFLVTLLLGALTAPAGAGPNSQSRGFQVLPISAQEALQRAVRALNAQGYFVPVTGAYFAMGFKDNFGACIIGDAVPGSTERQPM